jgi:hypothetical protein
MNTVKVKREELLTKVRANRDAHRTLFLKAQEGYRKLVIEELDRMLADAKAGRLIARSINLVEPADHIEDYDRVLAVDDTVILSAEEFSQYVLDRWTWSRFATSTNKSYAVGCPVPRPSHDRRTIDTPHAATERESASSHAAETLCLKATRTTRHGGFDHSIHATTGVQAPATTLNCPSKPGLSSGA